MLRSIGLVERTGVVAEADVAVVVAVIGSLVENIEENEEVVLLFEEVASLGAEDKVGVSGLGRTVEAGRGASLVDEAVVEPSAVFVSIPCNIWAAEARGSSGSCVPFAFPAG